MSEQVPGFVDEFIDKVLKNEGGYQNSSKDTGNYKKGDRVIGTNLGITPYTYAEYMGKDVSEVTEKEMKDLSEDTAREIYLNQYYLAPKFNLIPDRNLQENVFDMAVNSGPSRAIKILQEAAGAEADGILGPQTIQKIEEAGIDTNDYSDLRDGFYQRITESNTDNEKFLKGWLNRSDKYRIEDPVERAGVRVQEAAPEETKEAPKPAEPKQRTNPIADQIRGLLGL